MVLTAVKPVYLKGSLSQRGWITAPHHGRGVSPIRGGAPHTNDVPPMAESNTALPQLHTGVAQETGL